MPSQLQLGESSVLIDVKHFMQPGRSTCEFQGRKAGQAKDQGMWELALTLPLTFRVTLAGPSLPASVSFSVCE